MVDKIQSKWSIPTDFSLHLLSLSPCLILLYLQCKLAISPPRTLDNTALPFLRSLLFFYSLVFFSSRDPSSQFMATSLLRHTFPPSLSFFYSVFLTRSLLNRTSSHSSSSKERFLLCSFSFPSSRSRLTYECNACSVDHSRMKRERYSKPTEIYGFFLLRESSLPSTQPPPPLAHFVLYSLSLSLSTNIPTSPSCIRWRSSFYRKSYS